MNRVAKQREHNTPESLFPIHVSVEPATTSTALTGDAVGLPRKSPIVVRPVVAQVAWLSAALTLTVVVRAVDRVAVTVLSDASIRHAEDVIQQARDDVIKSQISPNFTFDLYTDAAEACVDDATSYKDIDTLFNNFYQRNIITVIGPTCPKDVRLALRITKALQIPHFNIFSDDPFKESRSLVQMTSRSTVNIGENIAGMSKGLGWSQISVIFCAECYMDDIFASENFFDNITKVLLAKKMEVRKFWKVKARTPREEISAMMGDLTPVTRVVFAFLGNNMGDYLEFVAAFKIGGYTAANDYRPVIVISRYSLADVSLPWTNDPSVLSLFNEALVLYNNYYDRAKIGSFIDNYSFTNDDEALISIQLYESLFVLANFVYASSAQNNGNYSLRKMREELPDYTITAPFGPIFFNGDGQRISGFMLVLINGSRSGREAFQSLLPLVPDHKCDSRMCLTLNLTGSLFQPNRDMPLCGFGDELCNQTTTFVMIIVVMVIVIGTTVTYANMRRLFIKQARRSPKTPWTVPFETIQFIDLSSTDGSHYMSIQSLQKRLEEKARFRSTVATKYIATIDQTYVIVDKYRIKDRIRFDKADSIVLYQMKLAQHDNLNQFVGFAFDKQFHMYHIWTQCFRGSLSDVVLSPKSENGFVMHNNFRGAFVRDILKGLDHIHGSSIGYHGALTSNNCMIDSHWILKLSGFGLNRFLFKTAQQLATLDGRPVISNSELHYYAPEMRQKMRTIMYANRNERIDVSHDFGRSSDIYSFGVVLYEILYGKKYIDIEDVVYTECTLISEQAENQIPARPVLPEDGDVHPDLVGLMQNCWNDPDQRPDPALARKITDATLKMSGSLVDQMMKNMEMYTNGLERLVAERTGQLEEEQQKADELLSELLPKSVADELKIGRAVNAKSYKSATILYSDIVGFTSLCSESQPMEVVTLLSGMYQRFDLIISQQNGYKMETIGDAYCVASGIPIASETEHVKNIAMISLLQRDFLHKFEIPHRPGQYLNCRWGFNTGAVFTGVVGIRAPRYAVFGPTVTIAAKMENSGVPDRIQMTLKSQQMIAENYPEFAYGSRGSVKIEGIGTLLTYWLEGINEVKPKVVVAPLSHSLDAEHDSAASPQLAEMDTSQPNADSPPLKLPLDSPRTLVNDDSGIDGGNRSPGEISQSSAD